MQTVLTKGHKTKCVHCRLTTPHHHIYQLHKLLNNTADNF